MAASLKCAGVGPALNVLGRRCGYGEEELSREASSLSAARMASATLRRRQVPAAMRDRSVAQPVALLAVGPKAEDDVVSLPGRLKIVV